MPANARRSYSNKRIIDLIIFWILVARKTILPGYWIQPHRFPLDITPLAIRALPHVNRPPESPYRQKKT